MKVLNLTPHDVTLLDDNLNVIAIYPKSGQSIRLISAPQDDVNVQLDNNIPVVNAQKWVGIDQSVEIADDVTHLLVSMPVGYYLGNPTLDSGKYNKYWILGPDAGPEGAVRNQGGQIIGTHRLVLYSKPHD